MLHVNICMPSFDNFSMPVKIIKDEILFTIMEISVRQTSIRPGHICRLLSHGIVLVSHLSTFDTQTLKQRTKLSLDECEQILTAIKPKRPHYVMRASELMVKPFEKITTLVKDLDYVMGARICCLLFGGAIRDQNNSIISFLLYICKDCI